MTRGKIRPGDPWAICDISGMKVPFSETRKTWDGLRVWKECWYPKHPQMSVKGIPEISRVPDARPRPADIDAGTPQYGLGTFCLTSPNGTNYIVYVTELGALATTAGMWDLPYRVFPVGVYLLTIDDDGTVSASLGGASYTEYPWVIFDTAGVGYYLTVDGGLNVVITAM